MTLTLILGVVWPRHTQNSFRSVTLKLLAKVWYMIHDPMWYLKNVKIYKSIQRRKLKICRWVTLTLILGVVWPRRAQNSFRSVTLRLLAKVWYMVHDPRWNLKKVKIWPFQVNCLNLSVFSALAYHAWPSPDGRL